MDAREQLPHERALLAVICDQCGARIGELCRVKSDQVCIARVMKVFTPGTPWITPNDKGG